MTYRELIAGAADRKWIDLDNEVKVLIYHRDKEGVAIQYEIVPVKMLISMNANETMLVVENSEIREYLRN